MMTETTERPEVCTDEMLEYLDDLRESGDTNMYGAGSFVGAEFCLTVSEARAVTTYWMQTFGREDR